MANRAEPHDGKRPKPRLTPDAAAKAQQILDAEARRLLAERQRAAVERKSSRRKGGVR
jgi:hypothetical protein